MKNRKFQFIHVGQIHTLMNQNLDIVGNCFCRQIHFGYKKLDENLQVFSINLNSIYYIKRTCTSKSHQYFYNVYEI